MTCQIAAVLSALLAAGPAQASPGEVRLEAQPHASVRSVVAVKKAVRPDGRARAILKSSPAAGPRPGAEAGS